ncbi:uncharacterized protein LOC135579298 isoform X2 [Columba livia]|uniref:uncharacterized protein LOC135579298 isoform X2 n=1 Tax=Columba livia TaxID=8932 RepID=UPI0031BA3316
MSRSAGGTMSLLQSSRVDLAFSKNSLQAFHFFLWLLLLYVKHLIPLEPLCAQGHFCSGTGVSASGRGSCPGTRARPAPRWAGHGAACRAGTGHTAKRIAVKEAVDLQFQSEEKQNLAWPLKSSFNLGSGSEYWEFQASSFLWNVAGDLDNVALRERPGDPNRSHGALKQPVLMRFSRGKAEWQ